eukprot:gene9220-biopygen15056
MMFFQPPRRPNVQPKVVAAPHDKFSRYTHTFGNWIAPLLEGLEYGLPVLNKALVFFHESTNLTFAPGQLSLTFHELLL